MPWTVPRETQEICVYFVLFYACDVIPDYQWISRQITQQLAHGHKTLGGATLIKHVCCIFVFTSAEKVNELQELLSKKDQEMKAMETKYKKYLEKAKSVSFMME